MHVEVRDDHRGSSLLAGSWPVGLLRAMEIFLERPCHHPSGREEGAK
ncbi:hypothetical protein F750_6826 [Streptomyces sp. PAMC 26508]|nr:hypothetical protein F750_6826 [Streptomyces sp. PAMC 26508]